MQFIHLCTLVSRDGVSSISSVRGGVDGSGVDNAWVSDWLGDEAGGPLKLQHPSASEALALLSFHSTEQRNSPGLRRGAGKGDKLRDMRRSEYSPPPFLNAPLEKGGSAIGVQCLES
jgi:hypothetical protein